MEIVQPEFKRDIFDGYKIANIFWSGDMSEVDFLSRIYNLTELPSNDSRYDDMHGDIWQHRINNDDWDGWWIIDDKRLGLDNFEKLKKFICETVHPLIRPDTDIANTIVDHINSVFEIHGLKERLTPIKHIAGRPVFSFQAVTVPLPVVKLSNRETISSKFLHEQIKKCEDKLLGEDYGGAITNARTFVEGVFGDIHERITGKRLPDSGDLKDDFKKIQRLLNLSKEQQSDDAAKGLISSIGGLLHNLEVISNKMGERHRPLEKPLRHHAKLCVDAALLICDFLYSSLDCQYGASTDIYERLIRALDSEIRLMPREELLSNRLIKGIVGRLDEYTSRIIIDRLIEEFVIPTFSGYKNNDIFFAALRIFLDHIEQKDLKQIMTKCKENNQAVGLPLFLNLIQKERPEIIIEQEVQSYLVSQTVVF